MKYTSSIEMLKRYWDVSRYTNSRKLDDTVFVSVTVPDFVTITIIAM